MMLKRNAPKSKSQGLLGRLRMTGAALVAAVSTVTLVVGCLDRPVVKQQPHTSNVFVAEIRQTAVDKIDLLFMIDNSISMADKQAVLADAVPVLLNRLVTPACVDAMGNQTSPTSNNGNCAMAGSSPEFSPIKDIHIGVVSSSLGAHGGQTCADAAGDDKGQLVQKVRPSAMVTTWAGPPGTAGGSGFLAWDPDTQRPRNNPPGETNANNLTMNFKNMVSAVDQTGCGYEGSLEAWYRFLIDPQPPTSVPAVADPTAPGAATTPVYDDNVQTNPVLMQRAQFLRPDSLLAIIMLSDENDCSIVDAGQGFLVGAQNLGGGAFHMPRSTPACETNPNDRCCVSCAAGTPPAGCAACPDTSSLSALDDNLNLRCYDQKRRFGFDLLYPVQRYVDGLWEVVIPNRDNKMVPNPIYAGSPPRDKSLVFLAGIVGVPWQDVSTTASHANNAPLKYLTYQEMIDQNRWDIILGNPGTDTVPPTPPGDKLMFETPKDRTTLFPGATHPLINAALAPATTTMQPGPNPINGHEANIADNSDLQYACIFPLTQSKDCSGGAAACDCKKADQQPETGPGFNRPLCNGLTQTHAKAYPGIRELRVLKEFGSRGTQNSIVASICPKTLSNAQDASYGYNPAVAAIIDRLKEALRGKCLPRKLNVEDDGTVPCAVVEANVPKAGEGCNCMDPVNKPGREGADDELKAAVYRQLSEADYCGDAPKTPCADYCLCKISQFTGNELDTCQTSASTPTNIFGYCYVDPSTATGAKKTAEEGIVAACPASQKRLLRFAGDGVPAKGSIAMIACIGSTIED